MTRARTILALILIVLGASLLFWPRDGGAPDTAAPTHHILADHHGRIELAVCVVNSARRSPLRNAATTTGIINTLPPHTQFLVLTNDRDAFTVHNDPATDRVRVLDLPAGADFTIWPQDPFVLIDGPEGARVLASKGFSRADDRLVAERVAELIDAQLTVSQTRFEGGNIVADEARVFIGVNTLIDNALERGEEPGAVLAVFERELGRPIVAVGPAPQPMGHLDMYLTPLGRGGVMLGDARLGAQLAERALNDTPDQVLAFEQACERMFFGDPSIGALQSDSGELRPPTIGGGTREAIAHSRSIADALDSIAEELNRVGYEVHRVPLLVGPTEQLDPSGAEARPSPGYPALTYNNVLVETTQGKRTVYLPRYGLPALDDAAATAWASIADTVVPVDGLTTSAMYGGSLRCCVKVLRRGE